MPLETGILEVNDVLYDTNRWSYGLMKLVVTKVTPKQAIAGSKKVVREITMRKMWDNPTSIPEVKCIGDYGHIMVETEELKKRYENEQLVKKAKRFVENINQSLITPENSVSLIEALSPFQNL